MKKNFNQAIEVVQRIPDAFRFLFRNGLGHYFLYPLLLGILLFLVGLYSASLLSEWIHQLLIDQTGVRGFLEGTPGASWILGIMLGILARMLWVYILFTFGRYLVLILMAPVLSLLAHRVKSILTGRGSPFSFGEFLKDAVRGMWISLRNFILETLIVGLLTLLMIVIPGIGFLLLIPMILTEAYYFGFSFNDHFYEQEGASIRESIRWNRREKGTSIAVGGTYQLISLIPFLGPAVGPILAMTVAVLTLEGRKEVDG